MVAVKSDGEDFGMEEGGCHQLYPDEGEGVSLAEEGETAGTFQIIVSSVVLCFCPPFVWSRLSSSLRGTSVHWI